MKVQFSPEFYRLYKKANVRIQHEIDKKITIFQKNHLDLQLNNHELHDEYEGFKSIDITNDYRAIFEEIYDGDELMAYFTHFDTHKNLYR